MCMKRFPANLHANAILFILVISAVIIGNLLSHLLLRSDVAKMSAEIHATEQKLLTRLDKLEKDNQYQKTYAEQAQKESARLQRSIEYHQGLMDRARTPTSPATTESTTE